MPGAWASRRRDSPSLKFTIPSESSDGDCRFLFELQGPLHGKRPVCRQERPLPEVQGNHHHSRRGRGRDQRGEPSGSTESFRAKGRGPGKSVGRAAQKAGAGGRSKTRSLRCRISACQAWSGEGVTRR
jgi:hypothetical protein